MNNFFDLRRNTRVYSPVSEFFMALFIAIVVFFIFMFLSMPIAYWCYGSIGIHLEKLTDVNNPFILPVLKYYQVVQSIGLFVIPPFVIAYFYSSSITEYLSLTKRIDSRQMILIAVMILSAIPLINLLASYNSGLRFPESWAPFEQSLKDAELSAENTTIAFMSTRTIGGLLFNLFMIAIIPAIGEELMFRGVFQRIFTHMSRNAHWGIIISSFLFSAIHFQFYGFLPRWILGMIFGYLLLWSGSMWAPMLAHFINNSFAVFGYFMINKGSLGKDTMDIGSSTDLLPFTIISTIVFMGACVYFHRLCKPK